MTLEISGIRGCTIHCFSHRNDGSNYLDDIFDQCVYYAHYPFVKEYAIVFYDEYKYEINGYNNDNIPAATIIPKITTKQEPDHTSLRLLFG
jgi:hypothetical protein